MYSGRARFSAVPQRAHRHPRATQPGTPCLAGVARRGIPPLHITHGNAGSFSLPQSVKK
jgi:hypothetical protein